MSETIKVHVMRSDEPAQPGVVTIATRITKGDWPPKEPTSVTSGRPTAFEQVKAQEKPIEI